jgi:glycosyltransferase involved in cell wall biosynthesis
LTTTTIAAATPPLRVVLWGTCDTGKPRVRILREGLRANGVDLLECRTDIWRGIQDKSQVKGASRWFGLLARVVLAYPALIWRYLRLPKHDWVLLGYPAIPDIFVIRLFAWLRGSRVAMDWFLSAYDTVVEDRRLVGRRHPLAWALRGIEWIAVRLADRTFMDTRAHAARMEGLFGLRSGACGRVWVGVEDNAFAGSTLAAPALTEQTAPAQVAPMQVLFYGQFIPLHGLPTIIEAARRLRDEPIDWLLIGRGQESERVQAMLRHDPLPRVRMLDWVDYEDLLGHIHAADACLGIFGTSDKAASVIPNKVFQILAACKPLITRDSPGVRELIGDEQADIALVDAGDARALATALLAWLANPPLPDPRRGALVARFTPAAIGQQCIELLQASPR